VTNPAGAHEDREDRGAPAATDPRGPRSGDRERLPRSPVTLAVLGVIAALGVVLLTSLGVWQVERRAWKLDLIDRIERRVHAAPSDLPAPADWPDVNARDDEYRRVRVSGTFLNDRETQVQAVTEQGGGFWVITPLRTAEGAVVLVNRGFVPADRRAPATRAAGQVTGPATVTGLVRMSEPRGGFLRHNDAAADRWFSRDVEAIAAARGLSHVAPFFIDADARSGPAGGPVGGLTVIAFPNNHFGYALTWFALALMVLGGFAYLLRDEWRLRASPRRITAATAGSERPLGRRSSIGA
jgi:surfeit locus 1 family protein